MQRHGEDAIRSAGPRELADDGVARILESHMIERGGDEIEGGRHPVDARVVATDLVAPQHDLDPADPPLQLAHDVAQPVAPAGIKLQPDDAIDAAVDEK